MSIIKYVCFKFTVRTTQTLPNLISYKEKSNTTHFCDRKQHLFSDVEMLYLIFLFLNKYYIAIIHESQFSYINASV